MQNLRWNDKIEIHLSKGTMHLGCKKDGVSKNKYNLYLLTEFYPYGNLKIKWVIISKKRNLKLKYIFWYFLN